MSDDSGVQGDDSGHRPVIAPLETCPFAVVVAGIDGAGTFILAIKCFTLEGTHPVLLPRHGNICFLCAKKRKTRCGCHLEIPAM